MSVLYSSMLISFYSLYGVIFTEYGFAVMFLSVLICCISAVRRFPRLRVWIPYIIIIFSYEALGGVYRAAESIRGVFQVFRLDHAIWGFNLTGVLQSTLFSNTFTEFMIWVYALHLPLVVFSAVFLWYVSKSAYFKYLYSLVLVVLLALFTFLVMPSAPPWYTGQAVNLLTSTSESGSLYHSLSSVVESDPLAAFPSLHAGLVILFVYGLWSARRIYGVLAIPIAGLVLLSTLYLGQHFMVDLIAGGIYSLSGIVFSQKLAPQIVRR
jgi:membrane-associated phospholipid phosphatase